MFDRPLLFAGYFGLIRMKHVNAGMFGNIYFVLIVKALGKNGPL